MSAKLPPKGSMQYLRPLLPPGYEHYFIARRAGRYFGLSIVCPTCGAKPPHDVGYGRRWRWLAAHQAVAHSNGKR